MKNYNWPGMIKITSDAALILFSNGRVPVFLLYDDDTEAVCYSTRDLFEHNACGGKFGIENRDELLANVILSAFPAAT